MQINREQLNKLASVDDEVLKNVIYNVAIASGANPAKAKLIASNAKLIKSKLATANEKDIEQIVSLVGEEKATEFLRMINNKL